MVRDLLKDCTQYIVASRPWWQCIYALTLSVEACRRGSRVESKCPISFRWCGRMWTHVVTILSVALAWGQMGVDSTTSIATARVCTMNILVCPSSSFYGSRSDVALATFLKIGLPLGYGVLVTKMPVCSRRS